MKPNLPDYREEPAGAGMGNEHPREAGFSLIEVMIAFVVLMVTLLGVFLTFTYAVNYNAGNNSRVQALTVLQQEAEMIRIAKFTPAVTDASVSGGIKPTKIVSSADGNRFRVNTVVDDDPDTPGVQVDNSRTVKEITITVTLETPTPGWQTAVPTIVVLRRVRSN